MGTKYTGITGTVGSYAVDNWSLSESGNVAEYVDTETAGWYDSEAGARRFSGSFEMTERPSFSNMDRVEDCAFFNGAETLTGDIRISEISSSMDRSGQDIVKWNVTFSGCGVLARVSGSGT